MVPRMFPPPADMSSPPPEILDEPPKTSETMESETGTMRPPNLRRSSEPTSETTSNLSGNVTMSIRSRNRSPFSRTHLRSRSSASSLSAPPMTRAHSSPMMDTTGRVLTSSNTGRPSSPLGPPGRRASPLRRPIEDTYPSFGGQLDIWETISENQELELTPRASTTDADPLLSSPLTIPHTFPRNRRRPSSPLYQMGQPTTSTSSTTSASASASTGSSPSLAPIKFNESYPSNISFSSSSMPSTPTSFRSRSPSISSLETIPDSPDAEEAALETEKIARLKAAADEEADGMNGGATQQRRSSVESPTARSMILGTNSFGVVFGARDKRKRWSVCGAERRGDLDLETIWED